MWKKLKKSKKKGYKNLGLRFLKPKRIWRKGDKNSLNNKPVWEQIKIKKLLIIEKRSSEEEEVSLKTTLFLRRERKNLEITTLALMTKLKKADKEFLIRMKIETIIIITAETEIVGLTTGEANQIITKAETSMKATTRSLKDDSH